MSVWPPQACNYKGEWREVSPALFSRFEKSASILAKNALIAVIYGLNFSLKVQFLRVSRRKNRRFFPPGPFFFALYVIAYAMP